MMFDYNYSIKNFIKQKIKIKENLECIIKAKDLEVI